jgi:hypothetical protein
MKSGGQKGTNIVWFHLFSYHKVHSWLPVDETGWLVFLMSTKFQLEEMKNSGDGLMITLKCECTEHHRWLKMVSFVLYIVYHNKKALIIW